MICEVAMKENTGKTKYVLLGLIAHAPQTGYSIKKAIEYQFSHFWQESYGQIYPTLKALVEEGLAEEKSSSKGGRGQISYGITEAGKEELKNWLSLPTDIEKLRYEILLKVAFGENTEPEIILGHLDNFILRNEKLMAEMDGFVGVLDGLAEEGNDHTYTMLTALCGRYIYTALRDWANDAKKLIEEREMTNYETKNS